MAVAAWAWDRGSIAGLGWTSSLEFIVVEQTGEVRSCLDCFAELELSCDNRHLAAAVQTFCVIISNHISRDLENLRISAPIAGINSVSPSMKAMRSAAAVGPLGYPEASGFVIMMRCAAGAPAVECRLVDSSHGNKLTQTEILVVFIRHGRFGSEHRKSVPPSFCLPPATQNSRRSFGGVQTFLPLMSLPDASTRGRRCRGTAQVHSFTMFGARLPRHFSLGAAAKAEGVAEARVFGDSLVAVSV